MRTRTLFGGDGRWPRILNRTVRRASNIAGLVMGGVLLAAAISAQFCRAADSRTPDIEKAISCDLLGFSA